MSAIDLARKLGAARVGAWTLMRIVRNAAQSALALFLLYAGWRFSLFVQHFVADGATPFVARPAVVEAFLPLSALIALRAWLATGVLDGAHPAGLAILLAVFLVSLLYGKGFCSWLCPIGAASEGLWRAGRRLFGRTFFLPGLIDWPLRAVKYLLLYFFVKTIFVDMSGGMAGFFLQSSYNKIADVKMLYFFLDLSAEVAIFLAVLAALSLVLPNFWCRYLCPYGAALGLLGAVAPFAVTRRADLCHGCGRCTRACPSGLSVATEDRISSPECIRCLDCLHACPRRGALQVGLPFSMRTYGAGTYAMLLMGTFFFALLVAQIVGYWHTSITYEEYAALVPRARAIGHLW